MKVEGITQSLKKKSHFSPKEKYIKGKTKICMGSNPMQLAKGYLIIVLKSKLGQKFSIENFDEEIQNISIIVQTGAKFFCRKILIWW